MSGARRALLAAVSVVVTGVLLCGGATTAGAGPDVRAQVVGGSPAHPTWTFVAGLFRAGASPLALRQFCGGALIAPRWVVTAAHCAKALQDNPGGSVVIGRHDLGAGTNGDVRGIRSIRPNANWTQMARVADIALIELDRPSTQAVAPTMTTDVEPVWDGSAKATIAGWGTSESQSGPLPNLLAAAVPMFPEGTCQRFLGPQFQAAYHLCGGDTSASACNGDSGGALFATSAKGVLAVAGISSFGPGVCGRSPSFYTRVSGYAGWIAETMAAHPPPVAAPPTTAKKPVPTTARKKPLPATVTRKAPATTAKKPAAKR